MPNPKYAYWEARQRGESPPPVNESPQPGFYRVRQRKDGPYVPLAIYESMGAIVGWLGLSVGDEGESVSGEKLNTLWTYACQKDISEKEWRNVSERGQLWSDLDATVAQAQREAIGGNNPPDEAVLLAEQIASARAGLKDYAEIKDDDHNARAQTLWSRLRELHNAAKKARAAAKVPYQPALDAVDKIDADYMPLEKTTKAGADKIRAAQNAYKTKQIREREAAQAKIDAERVKLEASGVRVPAFAPPSPLPTQIKGAIGRAAHSGEKTVVKCVDDWQALYSHFAGEDDIKKALVTLANIAVGLGHEVPGVTTEKIGKVR